MYYFKHKTTAISNIPRGQALCSTINDSEALWTCNSSEAINQNVAMWAMVVQYPERVKQIAMEDRYLIVSVAARYSSPTTHLNHTGIW